MVNTVEKSSAKTSLKVLDNFIFPYGITALAELSTRQIAEAEKAKGVQENAIAGKKGGKIAKDARLALEQKTGKKVVTEQNFLPPAKSVKKLDK